MKARMVALVVLGIGVTSLAFGQSRPGGEDRPPGAKAPVEDPAAAGHRAAVRALRTALLDLADWCANQKLHREQARVLETVLVFDPDDATARERLGWVKGKAGAWERSAKWKEQGNKNPEGLGDFKKKRAEVAGVFLDALTQVLEGHRRDIAPALRARIVGDMNAVDPEDPRSRSASGEAQVGGRWVLAETAACPPRRKKIEAWTKAAVAAVGKPEAVETAGDEDNFGVKWSTVVATENLRVLGTGSADETLKIAILCEAAGELFKKVFGVEITHQTAYRVPIYVIADAGSKAAFLQNNRAIKPERREEVSKLGGFHVEGAYVIWGAESVARVDCAVRMVVGDFMGRNFGLGADDGALYEGVGIHFSWFLTGTRLTWTIGKRKYAQSGPDALEDKLRKAGADWFGPGYELMTKHKPPLKPLLAKHVNDLETEDMLASYMLAVWMIEGREHDASRFLRAAGRKQIDAGALDAFGLEIRELEERILRWAKEMKAK
jgi:hypothetical protein